MLYCVQYWVSLQQVYMYIVCMVFIVSTLFIHTVKELILTETKNICHGRKVQLVVCHSAQLS